MHMSTSVQIERLVPLFAYLDPVTDFLVHFEKIHVKKGLMANQQLPLMIGLLSKA
jgi:hypothetical protein